MNNKNALILLIAGSSKRFGAKTKKQFIAIENKPIFVYTLESIVQFNFSRIILVVQKNDEYIVNKYINKYFKKKKIEIVYGADERVYSVYNAIKYLKENNPPKYIFIHDGVRPFVDKIELKSLEKELVKNNAAILAVKIVDTIKKVDSKNNIIETIDRTNLYRAATPQAFLFEKYLNAIEKYISNVSKMVTDDAEIYSMYEGKVLIVESSFKNIKITEKKDLEIYKKFRKR